jgi:hypothetical protein
LTPLPKILDQSAVQQGVRQVLETSFGMKVTGPVTCPSQQPVQIGHQFSCQAEVDGKQRTIPVTVRTADGEYEVAAPE